MLRAAIFGALFVSACASSAAPISYGGGAPAPARAEAPPAAPRPRAPQTEPNWAAGEGTPLSEYALRPEEAQPFDPANLPRTHRVREGESLFDIATTYQVPLRALIDQNNLQPPYALAPGREVELPPPRFHTVARGERFEDVARRYNVDTRSLALLNRMQPPYAVRQGDRVVLPAMARAREDVAAPRPGPAPAPSAAGARFAWPLQGEIAARFGAQPGRQRLDGIEIAGRVGAPVAAAAAGEVVYAGDDLPDYGYLVIIAHAENYVTAYGFTRRTLVREGDRVRAGQQIAELGERPGGGARLMFQVRLNGAPVDPAPLLGAN